MDFSSRACSDEAKTTGDQSWVLRYTVTSTDFCEMSTISSMEDSSR